MTTPAPTSHTRTASAQGSLEPFPRPPRSRGALLIAVALLSAAILTCGERATPGSGTPPPGSGDTPPADAERAGAKVRVDELVALGRLAEAEAIATQYELEFPGIVLTRSYQEVLDAGPADTANAGCVCCYSDDECTTIRGRSVDECFPDANTLSENVAPVQCVPGFGCAARARYACECRTRDIDCCGVATTSAFCVGQAIPIPDDPPQVEP